MKKYSCFLVLFCLVLTSSVFLYSKSQVLFSPEDRPTKKLIDLINAAQHKIHAAVYMITDKTIAEALIKAKKERSVDVQIITDKITMESSYGKGKLLKDSGVDVYVFDTSAFKKEQNTKFYNADPIMHNKFALIDKNVWTGSFNWTQAANRKNRENVLITDEKEIYDKYKKEFGFLKAGYCSVKTSAAKSGAAKTAAVKKQQHKKEEKIISVNSIEKIYLRFVDFLKETFTLAKA